jgi:putative colanic acid biosynthesis acetyltransferase WcaF
MSYRGYRPGRSFPIRALWLLVEAAILLNPIVTSYQLKRWTLKRFGAAVGANVVIKPGVHIKYPWHFRVGANAWIGERVWIDNFVLVSLGANVVVSQGAYLCTGNHDWSDPGMAMMVKPIEVNDEAWLAAFVRIAPGVVVGRGAVITMGSVLLGDAEPYGIYQGHPAAIVGRRRLIASDIDRNVS